MDWNLVIMDSVREMLNRVGGFLPRLVGVLLILIIGWLLAKFIQTVITRVLKLIRLDTLSEKSGASTFLAKGGIKYTLSELLGALVYWIIMLIVIILILIFAYNFWQFDKNDDSIIKELRLFGKSIYKLNISKKEIQRLSFEKKSYGGYYWFKSIYKLYLQCNRKIVILFNTDIDEIKYVFKLIEKYL